MSDSRRVLRTALSGLFGAMLLAFAWPMNEEAAAAGLHQALVQLGQSGPMRAQVQPPVDAAVAPTDGSDDAAHDTAEDENAPFSELDEALTAAKARLAELTKAAEIAQVAGELREQLEAAKAENKNLQAAIDRLQSENDELRSAKLSDERRIEELGEKLAHAETAARESSGALQQTRTELMTQIQGLTVSTEESATEIARLRQDLDSTITELDDARSELLKTREDLDNANISLAAAHQEGGVLREQVVVMHNEAEQLRNQLENTEADLERAVALNTDLQHQIGVLHAAASEATNVARINLTAVEDQIDEINAALASVKYDSAALPEGNGSGDPKAAGTDSADEADAQSVVAASVPDKAADAWVPRPSPARDTARQQLIAAASTDILSTNTVPDPIVASPDRPLSGNPLARHVDQSVTNAPAVDVASLIEDLPTEHRSRAEKLLAKMDVKREERGLSMTVPGTVLFAVASERIEPSAHDTLADIAELINLYDGHDVLIVGHTDAVGDADYNQQLSERRAKLVKAFFVEKFDIDDDRLSIEGQGEQEPITSNTTRDGRRANRRVEVIVLN